VLDFAIKYNGPSGQADVVIDVVGYFVENQHTALECTLITGPTSVIAAGASLQVFPAFPACPTGYTSTATECFANSFLVFLGGTADSCVYRNTDTVAHDVKTFSPCCRVPGQ
jgi:hypothetical protein